MNIPFSPPDIGEEEIQEVVDTLRSGWITTGPKTKQFEKEIAAFCGASGVACLNSATAADELTLRVLGVHGKDEVIVPAYTYTASASVVYHVGATLKMVDCAPGSFQMDYGKLEEMITENTKVIVPVDLAGMPCDYNRIFEIVERKRALFRPENEIQKAIGRVVVLTDAAHALGAQWHGMPVGSIADFTTFSFHAVKNLTTGEGGAVAWRPIPGIEDEEIYRKYMLLSLHGQSKDALAKTKLGAWEYDIVAPYFKCNMTDIMASIGLAQLKRYPSLLKRRKEIIAQYHEGLSKEPVEVFQHDTEEASGSGHLYLVRLTGKTEKERNAFITRMAEMGVATNVHYKPLPMHTAYRTQGFSIQHYSNAYQQYQNEVTLPLHTGLTDDHVRYVLDCFHKCL